MCIGVPMEIVAVDGDRARCSAKGVEREANLLLIRDEPLSPGDFILVHLGYATRKMTPEEARSTWELLDEILASEATAASA